MRSPNDFILNSHLNSHVTTDIKPEQAGAELCQAQVKLKVLVEAGVEF